MTVPPHDAHVDRLSWGLRQPIQAARVILMDPKLLRESLYPAVLLALVCAGVAVMTTLPGFGTIKRFYTVFVALAPWPSVFLAAHYQRLAAQAHAKLGYGPAAPVNEPIIRAIRRALGQAVLIAIAVAPVSIFVGWLPLLGTVIVKAVAGGWALHWIVVNALDSARVLLPGQTLDDLDRVARETPPPWFVRLLGRVPWLRWFADLCDQLAWPWREEMLLVEEHPSLVGGFAISTAALLALPVFNLFFRPVVLVASLQVLHGLATVSASPAAPAPVPAD
jgi:hypothetical protein